jgi:hypothetical protein
MPINFCLWLYTDPTPLNPKTMCGQVSFYNAYNDTEEESCNFQSPGRDCMNPWQALHDFHDTSQVSIYKNNKMYLSIS